MIPSSASPASKWIVIVACVTVVSLGFCSAASAEVLFGYAGNNNDLYSIDTTTVTATLIGHDENSGIPSEIEYGNGFIYLADTGVNNRLHSMEPDTGEVAITRYLKFPAGGNVLTALEFVGPTLYGGYATEGQGNAPSSLVTIDLSSRVVSVVGLTGINAPLGGLAYDGTTMYAVSAGGQTGNLYTVDLVTGSATLVGATGFGMTALEFGTDGTLYGLSNTQSATAGHLFQLDKQTGVATDLGDLGVVELNGLTAVPEPSTIALWSVLACLGFCAWRRR